MNGYGSVRILPWPALWRVATCAVVTWGCVLLNSVLLCLAFVARPLYPNVDADGPSYFRFKCPCPRLGGTALCFSAVHR
jgi:hypothetical protein